MKAFVILALALLAFDASAQNTCTASPDCTFRWTPPTLNVDGSVLLPAEIAGYNFSCTVAGGGVVAVQTVAGPVTSVVRRFQPGTFTCALITQSIFGTFSVPSNAVVFTIARPNPNAATGFSVE